MSSTLTPNAKELAAAPAGLSLVCSDPAHEQRVDLVGEPITLGAGPRCSLRLKGSGFRPLHCVVTPTEAGPVVRRWAAQTLLNGQEFTEATLATGDCLRVGGIDFLIVASSRPEAAGEGAAPPAVEAASGPAPLELTGIEAATDEFQPDPEFEVASDSQAFETFDEIQAEVDSLVEPQAVAETPGPDANDETERFGSREADASTPAVKPIAEDDAADAFAAESSPFSETAENEPLAPANGPDESRAAQSPFASELGDTPSDNPWGFAPEPERTGEAIPWTAEGSSEAADIWRAEFSQSEAAANSADDQTSPPPTAEAIESFANETTPAAATEGEAFSLEDVAVAVETPASWRGRITAGRQRVRRLARSLRECRERIATLESQVADRDAAVARLETRFLEVADTADSAAKCPSEPDEVASRPIETEQALEAANESAAELDQPFAVEPEPIAIAEEPIAETPSVAADEVIANPPEAEEAFFQSQAPVEALPQEQVGDWQQAGGEPLLGGDSAETTPAELVPAESNPVESVEPEEAVAASDPWGIEQLVEPAPIEQPISVVGNEETTLVEAEVSPLWGDPIPHDGADEASAGLDALAGSEQPPVETPAAAVEPLAAFQPRTETVSDEPAGEESFISKYAHLLPDDETPAEPVASVEPVVPADEQPESAEEDESIDDYMRRLMERVRGGSDSPAEGAADPQPAASPVAPSQNLVSDPVPEPEPESAPLIKDLSELKRSPTVEPAADMGALRQLANQSARHALDAAATKESRERATLRLTAAAVAFGCGLMAAIASTNPFSLQFTGGLLAAGVGGWFGFRTLRGCATKNPAQHLIDSHAD